jgi:hypothetical protein
VGVRQLDGLGVEVLQLAGVGGLLGLRGLLVGLGFLGGALLGGVLGLLLGGLLGGLFGVFVLGEQ